MSTQYIPLSGVLNNLTDYGLLKQGNCRVYNSTLTMKTKIHELPDVCRKIIEYEIQPRGNPDRLMNISGNEEMGIQSISCPIKVSDDFVEQIAAINRRITNVSCSFDTIDLCGLGFHLAKSYGYYIAKRHISCKILRCGKGIRLRGITTATEPISIGDNSIIIPKSIARNGDGAAYSALCSAANGVGAIVYTDVLELGANNEMILREYENADLARGILVALHILLSMYSHLGYGNIMALAIIRGLHTMHTVVGQSDEGGIMREILRSGSYTVPYGGIGIDRSNAYYGLPIPSRESWEQNTALHDTICIYSAALVAIADPGMELNGKNIPSVICVDRDSLRRVTDVGDRLLNIFSQFSKKYCDLLGRMFCVHDSGSNYASDILDECATLYVNNATESRHILANTTLFPFFWIEPTTIIDRKMTEYSGTNVTTPLCYTTERIVRNVIGEVGRIEQYGERYTLQTNMMNARNMPFIHYLHNHTKNGLGLCTVMNMNTAAMLGANDDPEQLLHNEEPLSKYLWGRGQSDVIHPGEMVYSGTSITFCVKSINYNGKDLRNRTIPIYEHVWSVDEIADAVITYTCTRPTRTVDKERNKFDSKRVSLRTKAMAALELACMYKITLGKTGGERLIPTDSIIPMVLGDALTENRNVVLTTTEAHDIRPHNTVKYGERLKATTLDIPTRPVKHGHLGSNQLTQINLPKMDAIDANQVVNNDNAETTGDVVTTSPGN